MTTLLWLKRDLRVADHPALARANGYGDPVVPVFVIEPEYWALPDTSARQWAHQRECLIEACAAFAALGAPVCVELGDAAACLAKLAERVQARRMISHEETGNLWTYRRDLRVKHWARTKGLPWEELPQCGVIRPLPDRDGWARARDAFVFGAQVASPKALAPNGIEAAPVPDIPLADDPCPARQRGGRSAGLALLDSFLNERGQTYRRAMSSPLAGAQACSRLSPYLAHGALSLREVAQAGAARQRDLRGTRTGWCGSLKSFQARLAWRDHFIQKLEDAPRIETHCLHSAYETLRPRESDAARLHAWAAGETGIPFVDACMRSLRHTGWLNFRMRSMVMAVASYHLWLDWRSTGPVLARLFTDYEPGIHWSQVQMQSGTTGMNTIRIYNPVKQGKDQDPDGIFTRRWVPELAQVPDQYLQEPWLWEGARHMAYPAPIVDVMAAARAAREAVWAVRSGAEFHAEAAHIVRKHASRKDRQRRFVRDGATARKEGPQQMSFEF